jgi:iron-sulfur cluster repair protein YtfE (RIC family)
LILPRLVHHPYSKHAEVTMPSLGGFCPSCLPPSTDLKTHFKVEEEIVFSAMSGIEDSKATIDQLVDGHRKLENLVQRLQEARDAQLAPLLRKFADLLEAHIRIEERVLFPRYEQGVSSELARHVGIRVLEVIGTGMQPKHPNLLE